MEKERGEEGRVGGNNDIVGPILPPGMHTVHSTVRGPDLTQLRPSSTFPPPMIEGKKSRLSLDQRPPIPNLLPTIAKAIRPLHRLSVTKPKKSFGGRINI